MSRKTDETRALTPITAILQERAFDLQRQRTAELARIEGEIREIDHLLEAAMENAAAITTGRMIGADTLWSEWILQRRADLLRQSAIARARQAESLARARSAFARHQAALSLVEEAHATDRHRDASAEMDRLQDTMILKALWET